MNENEKETTGGEDYSNDELINSILNAKSKVEKVKQETVNAPDGKEEAIAEISEPKAEEKPQMPKKNKKKKRGKKSPKKVAFGLVMFSVIVIISAILAMAIITLGMEISGLSSDRIDTEMIVEIPEGATGADVAQILYENEVIKYPTVFRLMANRQGGEQIKAGKHTIVSNMSYSDLIDTLKEDPIQEKISVEVTFPEGYTLEECAKILEDAQVCRADEFITAFNSGDFGYNFEKGIEDTSDKYYKMEGYCFPDTYTFFQNSDPAEVSRKIYANYAEKVNANMIGRMKELGLSIDETMALASIVQAEAPNFTEMKKVSSVFWNRLNSDDFPKLQSDPTIKYAKATGLTDYDTYSSEGIPPGAICNPGIDAINAVLYPEDTDYYYFCSNLSTQEFFYAKTLAQHERNLAEAGLV